MVVCFDVLNTFNLKIRYGFNWFFFKSNYGFLYKYNFIYYSIYKRNIIYLFNLDKLCFNYNISLKYMLRNVNLAYSGYFFKIYLVGRFYSIRVLDEKRIVLKFGYSKDIIYNLPFGLDFFLLNNRKGYYLFYSINYGLIKNLVFYLRKLREVSPYTGRGVRYYKEKVDRKEGKAVFI